MKIFTESFPPYLSAAKERGDWNNTAKLLRQGSNKIIDIIKESGLRGRGGAGFNWYEMGFYA